MMVIPFTHKVQQSVAQRGFTLIELLIVITVLTLLAATAYPSYKGYQQRVIRAQAQQMLLDIALEQQQRLLQYGTYLELENSVAVTTELSIAVPSKVTENYSLSVVFREGVAQQFVATALPLTSGLMSGEETLTINEQGNRTPAEQW